MKNTVKRRIQTIESAKANPTAERYGQAMAVLSVEIERARQQLDTCPDELYQDAEQDVLALERALEIVAESHAISVMRRRAA